MAFKTGDAVPYGGIWQCMKGQVKMGEGQRGVSKC